uniref:Uncharacterized protein n=1 Tax=Romanomermis culicivorax TaxID=13658 RepID=A0A915HL74_ROMCU
MYILFISLLAKSPKLCDVNCTQLKMTSDTGRATSMKRYKTRHEDQKTIGSDKRQLFGQKRAMGRPPKLQKNSVWDDDNKPQHGDNALRNNKKYGRKITKRERKYT